MAPVFKVPTFPAHILEPAGVPRSRWPVTAGLPFAPGELREAGGLGVVDEDGRPLPAWSDVRARWPDGSVRWSLLDLQVEMRAQQRLRLNVEPRSGPGECQSPLRAEVRGDAIDVLTGEMALRIGRQGHRLIRSVSKGRREFLSPGGDGDLTAWDGEGTACSARIEDAEIEEANPLRLVVRCGGRFMGPVDPFLGFEARITCFAHQSFLRIDFTFVHDLDQPPELLLRRLALQLPLALDRTSRRALVGSQASGWTFHDPIDLAATDSVDLTQWNLERHCLRWGAGRRVDRRTNCLGWLHVADGESGVTCKLRRPFQSYPKRWAFEGERLCLELFPDLSGFLGPEGGSGRRYTEIDYAGGVRHDRPLRLPQGMARTHEIYLHFGPRADDPAEVDRFCLASEMPLLLQLPSSRYAETGVFGPFAPFSEDRWPLELKLRRFCRTPNGRGILNDGDQVRLESLPDGRVVTRTTENLAYELPRSILWQYLRSGDQRLFWEAEAAVRHLMDVDTVHHQSEHPEWIGGPCFQWSQNHHYTNTDETALTGPRTSHTWLGSLLDYYFLTGYRRARQVAEMCADYCRRSAPYQWREELTPERASAAADGQPVHWPFSTRSVGWALTGMGTYYDAFPEDRFLPAMEALVDLLEVWQDEHGRWRDRIGTHNLGETPFMVAGVLQGLLLYHGATGEERARRMMLAGARFLARHGRTPEGLFYYKEAPISADPHTSTAMLLGPLAWAHEQTGEADLLDAGYRMFRWLVDEGAVSTYMLKDLFAFMPLLEGLGLLDDYEPSHFRAPAPGEGPSGSKEIPG